MKKRIHLIAAAAAVLAACTPDPVPSLTSIQTLDFEGENFTKLIDTPQYGGPLLYSKDRYRWNDTYFYHMVEKADWGVFGWGWEAGAAISNYTMNTYGDYETQLAVMTDAAKGGHNGSENFAVWTGHDWGSGGLPDIISDNLHVLGLREMYVNNTAYGLSECYNAEGKCVITEGNQVYVEITALFLRDMLMDGGKNELIKKDRFYLVDGPSKIVKDWTRWDLSDFQVDGFHLISFTFNVDGNIENEYGFSFPAYFAFDDLSYLVGNDSPNK